MGQLDGSAPQTARLEVTLQGWSDMQLGSCVVIVGQVPLGVESTPSILLEGLLTVSELKTTPTCPWRERIEKLNPGYLSILRELSCETWVGTENGSVLFHQVVRSGISAFERQVDPSRILTLTFPFQFLPASSLA